MRILGIERDLTACNYYRVLLPLSKLDEQKMADVAFVSHQHLDHESTVQKVLWADVVVIPRPADESWFKFLKLLRQQGKVVISDYDDDPFNTSPLNPYYLYVGIEKEVNYRWADGEEEKLWYDGMPDQFGRPNWYSVERNLMHRDMFRLNFKKSDLITCTTDVLRQEFLKVNPNVAVLPNLIDLSIYPKLDFVKKEVRIGWQGGASHYEDLWMIKDALKEVLRKNDNVKFVYYGDSRFYGLFRDIPDDKFEYVNWTKHNAYSYRLATLNLDIGICPLWDNQFNRNKSAIKYFEYSAVGAATIASNIPPYSEVITNEKDGLLVGPDKKDWVDAIQSLIENVQKRNRLAENAYENIYENHNVDKKVYLWRDAYEKIFKNEMVTA